MGQRVLSAVHGAMRALEERDRELADEVIAFDDEVDNHFLGIEHSIQALLALQTPVARDLRLLLAMIHINLLLERSARRLRDDREAVEARRRRRAGSRPSSTS